MRHVKVMSCLHATYHSVGYAAADGLCVGLWTYERSAVTVTDEQEALSTPVRGRPRIFGARAPRACTALPRGKSSAVSCIACLEGSRRVLLTSAAGPAACSYLEARRVLVRRCGQRYASTMSCHPCAGAEIESSRVPRTDQSSALQTCSSPWSTGPNMAVTRTGKR